MLSKAQLLIIDDWGLEPLKPAHRNDLLEIMDDRPDRSSTLIISQLPSDQWYVSIWENTLADHFGLTDAQRSSLTTKRRIHEKKKWLVDTC